MNVKSIPAPLLKRAITLCVLVLADCQDLRRAPDLILNACGDDVELMRAATAVFLACSR